MRFNPFHNVLEGGEDPHTRTRRDSLEAKLKHTFSIFTGRYDEKEMLSFQYHWGVLDFLFLGLPVLLQYGLHRLKVKEMHARALNLAFSAVSIISDPFSFMLSSATKESSGEKSRRWIYNCLMGVNIFIIFIKGILSGVLSLISSPIVYLVHLFFIMDDKALASLKKDVLQYKNISDKKDSYSLLVESGALGLHVSLTTDAQELHIGKHVYRAPNGPAGKWFASNHTPTTFGTKLRFSMSCWG